MQADSRQPATVPRADRSTETEDQVTVRLNPRARRLSIKVDGRTGAVVLVVPPRTPRGLAERFLAESQGWIAARQAALPPKQPFVDGAVVSFQGAPHRIRHRPGTRGAVWIDDGEIHVAGAAEHLARRLRDWLSAQARERLTPRAHDLARSIDRQVRRISIRDTRTRWGSCSPKGHLAFSWRLILAPPFVADYLVAHEVAHLRHFDHGPDFWRLVDTLTPDRRAAERWLRQHGGALQRIG